MAITVPDNMSYGGKKPNFDRDQFATLAEMTSYPADFLDEGHISYCVETKKVYIWNGLSWEVLTSTEIVNTTYSELKNLRDNSQLVAGTTYRLTDYEFTTVQENTRSAGHGFDIILQALTGNTLSEKGFALPHDGDSYFDGNSLTAWQIWYTLENDSSVYGWADEVNGKGVIYKMVDDKRNECAYDFKNALFFYNASWHYTFSITSNNEVEDISVKGKNATDNIVKPYFDGKYIGDVYTGVYKLGLNILITTKSGNIEYYTIRNNTLGRNCKGNIIESCTNCFLDEDCYDNKLSRSRETTFHARCSRNNIHSCSYFVLGEYCRNNMISSSDYTELGYGCYNNNFSIARNLKIGRNCERNSNYTDLTNFAYLDSLTLGNNCTGNTFGNNCTGNTFGDNCSNNTLGNNCTGNTFGDNCSNNELKYQCVFNNLAINCRDNTIGNYCTFLVLQEGDRGKEIERNNIKTISYEEYYDDDSGKLVPVKHPNLSTQPSILPYKLAGEYVYELIRYIDTIDAGIANVVEDALCENVLLLEAVVIELTSSGSTIYNNAQVYSDGNKIYAKGLSADKYYWVRVVWSTSPKPIKDDNYYEQ